MNDLVTSWRARWYLRVPAKWTALSLVALVVCFPYPRLLARHIQHWRNPNALINPDSPALAPMLADARQLVPEGTGPTDALKSVEELVLMRIPYAWDWDNWGMADYLPTVEETLEKGAEDCDGRAVIAASLLSALGYDAKLVTDFAHVWVRTEHGDVMGPGRTTAIVATDRGLRLRLGGLIEVPKAFAYGVAVFPVHRELIILLAGWFLLNWPGFRWKPAAVSVVFLVAGLLLIRGGSLVYLKPVLWLQMLGMVATIGGIAVPFVASQRKSFLRRAGVAGPGDTG